MYLESAKKLLKRLKILLQSKIFFILSLIFIISYVFIITKVINYHSVYKESDSEVVGEVIDFKIDGDKLSIVLKGKEKLQCFYYFSSLKEKEKFQNQMKLGIKIKIFGTFSKPQNNTIPNTFNYKNYLYSKKIYWLVNITKIDIDNKNVSLLYKIKNSFVVKVNSLSKTKSYMHAFILGDSSYIDYNIYENFQNNGITHLFAVSGMHIGLFVTVINNLLKKLKFKDNLISYFTIVFFIFYLFLVGFTASVVRATMFYTLLFFNKRFNWNFRSLKLFYLLFLILLIINPFYINDIGFIYSFLTSLGLMLFSKKITGNYITKLIKTSSIAFMFSLPITIYLNYEFNLLTIINNLIVVPIVSLVLFPLSLLTFIFPFLEVFLKFGFSTLEIINFFLSKIAINITIGKISIIMILLYYFIVYLIYRYKIKYVFILILLILSVKYKSILDCNNYVYFLDVNQGDATLIVTEYQKDIILIDSGGKIEYEKEYWQIRNSNFSLADNLSTFIKSLGISKIDLFIGTHGDLDHIGYAKDLFETIKVKKIMLNNNQKNNFEKNLINKIDKRITNTYKGNQIYINNLNNKIAKDENESSLVIATKIGKLNFLFMGDAPTSVEAEITKKYHLNIDVLKVGHHGSNTSSSKEFINIINPKFSIISVGKNNRYGHPNQEVLDNLSDSKIYRTDTNGSIIFKIRNNKLNIKTCNP